jgi:hypothetical protein
MRRHKRVLQTVVGNARQELPHDTSVLRIRHPKPTECR